MIAAFSNAHLILVYRDQHDDQLQQYTSFISDYSGNILFDSFIQQLSLALANIQMNNISDNKFRALIWIYILLAFIITNVALFNILIAIVGDTYERIMATRERARLIEKVQITVEFIELINFNPMVTQSLFVYMIDPVEETNEE